MSYQPKTREAARQKTRDVIVGKVTSPFYVAYPQIKELTASYIESQLTTGWGWVRNPALNGGQNLQGK